MPSDGNPAAISATSLAPAGQALIPGSSQPGGNAVPVAGKNVAAAVQAGSTAAGSTAQPQAGSTVPRANDSQSLVDLLNRYLNDSGRPDQFRVDPASGGTLIQQINPATGKVLGEFSASEFPALARSVGATSLLIDSRV